VYTKVNVLSGRTIISQENIALFNNSIFRL